MVIEPVMSGVGIVVPPDEYLPMVEDICRRYGVLLIIDEVINGFGRTGKLFAHQWSGIKPDLVSVAKGIASGYLPLGATAASDKVFRGFLGEADDMKHAVQINTYGGHAAACAAALANLDIIEGERLAERAHEMGGYFLQRLHEALESLPAVGDIRGRGLLIGVELVRDRATRAPMDGQTMGSVVSEALERGVIISKSSYTGRHLSNTITLSPPLVITREEIDRVVSTLRDIIGSIAVW